MSKRSSKHLFFLILTLFLIVPVSVPAQSPIKSLTATPISLESIFQLLEEKPAPGSKALGAGEQGLISVIVKLRGEPLVSYRGGILGLAQTASADLAARVDVKSSEAQAYLRYLDAKHSTFETAARQVIPQLRVTHRFNVVLNAMSILVPADQVKTLAALPGVEAVYMDELLKIQTDSSPLFVGATTLWQRLGGEETAAEDVIVGILDTGIWPEHPSFSDPDPSGKPYGVLASWSGTACQFGSAEPGDAAFSCNNKLLGAERIMTTYDAVHDLLPGEFPSARDDGGHGTHTSSTAAGNATVPASIFGTSWGDVSGIAPRARVAMYKVCGDAGCYSSDSAAAVQQAILDGVNVINFSISGGSNPYTDVVSLAFRDAYAAGVFVAASAGNSGPQPDSVDHREPWVTTVAASTQIRAFVNEAELTADGGAMLTLGGTSVTGGTTSPKTIVVPLADELCLNPFAPGSVTDQVVVCRRGTNARVAKGYNVLQGGAAGMILYNASANQDLDTDNHFLPATQIQYEDGQALLSFIGGHTNVLVTLTDSYKAESQGDLMASFSSRGGVGQGLGISKPDITAPGVQILAGHTPLPATMDGGHPGELFQAIQGTSMSSPHIAGAAALLKALRPRWTPGQIKSAIMMTATTAEVFKEDGSTPAGPFDYGSGRVDLSAASRAWLTMDATAEDFVTHQDDLWNANYPSVYISSMPGILTVKRKVHNELASSFSMRLRVSAPSDVKITVPGQISLTPKGNAKLTIKVDARNVPIGETRTATVFLIKGTSSPALHIPITFVRRQAVVELAKSCDPAEFTKGSTTACTITMTNSTFNDATVNMTDKVPGKLKVIARSVTGATSVYENTLKFRGTLAAAQPPDVTIGAGSSPSSYLPLSSFGIPPIANMGDESIANYSTDAFTYAGETYTGLGVVSNGYVVVGGGTSSDVRYLNQNLPNSSQPNNVLAPFWTDLNPEAAGGVRIASLTDGVDTWIVIDWEGVKEYSTANTASFQVWIGIDGDTHPGEDISYAYGTIQGSGNLGLLTVGAENKFGNRGGNYYYNGSGSLPANGTQLRVTGTPGVPGGTHLLSFNAKGVLVGDWTNYATMTSDQFQGTSIAPMSGKVLP